MNTKQGSAPGRASPAADSGIRAKFLKILGSGIPAIPGFLKKSPGSGNPG